jgi:hypothetical protein
MIIRSAYNIFFVAIAVGVVSGIIGCNFGENPVNAPPVPEAPTLSSPNNGAQSVALTPTLSWNSVSGASSYKVQVAADSIFSTGKLAINDSTLTVNSMSISNSLTPSTKYYWRVYAKNSEGSGQASAIWNFTTIQMLDTTTTHIIAIRDSAILDSAAWNKYFFQLNLDDKITKTMAFDPTVGNKYPGSIYSTANSTARAQTFSELGGDPEYDSIVGIEFYLMAKSSAKTNFIAFLGKEGGSIRNSAYYVGMGFDKSDSIKILWTSNAVSGQESKNVAPISFGKWYKCTVEYDITNYTATYYLDGKAVGTHEMPSVSTFGYNMFVVYRDAKGQDGTAPYYFNDFTLYEIEKKQ